MTQKIQIPSGAGQEISALYTRPDNKAAGEEKETLIIMAHGFPGHKAGNNDLFGDLEFMLGEKGYHLLRFDFRGCGDSDGKEEEFSISSATEDFQNVILWAKTRNYKSFCYIGEGFGASMALMNLNRDVITLCLLWPILDVPHYYNAKFAHLTLDDETRKKGYLELDGHKYGLEFIKQLKNTSLASDLLDARAPTLILHGAQDDVIPISHLDMAREGITARRIEITTFHDGGHGLQKLSHRKMVFYHLTQFVTKYF